jgi:predicted nucleic acid-binding protein
MARLYLDAAPVVYTVEQVAPFAAWVDARLSPADVIRVSSELTRLECRIKPLRTGDAALLQDFEDFFAGTVAEMVGFSRAVWDAAAEIRAKYGFRTPDSLHLAAATSGHCDVFLTNDHRLDRFPDIPIEVVPP